MIAPLIEQETAIIGGRDVEVLLQDYDQMTLVPLPRNVCSWAPRCRSTSRWLAGRSRLTRPGD